MSYIYALFRWLDRKAFLGFRAWQFSFRSLNKRYARTFIWEIVAKHPLRSFKGLVQLRRFSSHNGYQGDFVLLGDRSPQRVAYGDPAWECGDEQEILVGMGYCQKPQPSASGNAGCPAGRFNHTCHLLSHPDSMPIPSASRGVGIGTPGQEKGRHPVCQNCAIAATGIKALEAGASFYIMTSAEDVARDLMMSAINQRRFSRVILFLCPYSADVIAFPLFVCGLDGYIIKYIIGSCLNFEQFTMADRGIKRQRTDASQESYQRVETILELLAEKARRQGSSMPVRFLREGNIYYPVKQ